jgi:hypothetical protein
LVSGRIVVYPGANELGAAPPVNTILGIEPIFLAAATPERGACGITGDLPDRQLSSLARARRSYGEARRPWRAAAAFTEPIACADRALAVPAGPRLDGTALARFDLC